MIQSTQCNLIIFSSYQYARNLSALSSEPNKPMTLDEAIMHFINKNFQNKCRTYLQNKHKRLMTDRGRICIFLRKNLFNCHFSLRTFSKPIPAVQNPFQLFLSPLRPCLETPRIFAIPGHRFFEGLPICPAAGLQ